MFNFFILGSQPHKLLRRRFGARLDAAASAYLRDHAVHGQLLCPGAVFLEAAAEAAHMLRDRAPGDMLLRSTTFASPLLLTGCEAPILERSSSSILLFKLEARGDAHMDAGVSVADTSSLHVCIADLQKYTILMWLWPRFENVSGLYRNQQILLCIVAPWDGSLHLSSGNAAATGAAREERHVTASVVPGSPSALPLSTEPLSRSGRALAALLLSARPLPTDAAKAEGTARTIGCICAAAKAEAGKLLASVLS